MCNQRCSQLDGVSHVLGHAFLLVTAAHERIRHPTPDSLIPLTCNETQHLFTCLAPARPRRTPPAPLVAMATLSPSPSSRRPLPTTNGAGRAGEQSGRYDGDVGERPAGTGAVLSKAW